MPEDAVEKAREWFLAGKLAFPPVPAEFVPRFEAWDRCVFGTRRAAAEGTGGEGPVPVWMYDFDAYVAECEAGVEDYVLMGCAGHGFNSYAAHYYLVCGPLAVFVQTLWGGVYTDNDRAAARFSEQIEAMKALMAEVKEAAPRFPAGGRLLVAVSERARSRWRAPRGPAREKKLFEGAEALDEARIWVRTL
jgi:hypothetical protein